MADRYKKGKEFVSNFMKTRQKYVACGDGLADVHADILMWQSHVCGSGTGRL